MATVVSVTSTNNPEIDGLLGGSRWTGPITYSFPDSPNDYPANYFGNDEPTTAGFTAVPAAMQLAITYSVGLISSYTNISLQFAGTGGADVAIAQSPAADPTSYAYYPDNVAAGGDIWFGTAYNYAQAQLGNYYFAIALHEFGHSLGLKDSQEMSGIAGVAVPVAHDNSEYTVMSYRSYAGAPLTGYTAEAYGYPQTYMANDIVALQTLYGANFGTHSENTVYSWSPTTGQQFINGVAQLAPGTGAGGSSNRIFETVWDGNGVDFYDFSNYTTPLRVNLNPGASSTISATQLAYLGNGHYAAGNIYNAYLFNGDARSYIDNAVGGTGDDSIIGNAIANALYGGAGNDTLTGGGGNDNLVGGSGTDIAVFSGNRASYLVSYNAGTQAFTVTDQRGGTPDGTDTVTGVEYFQFADTAVASSTLATPAVNHAPVVTIPSANVSASARQVIAASSLFSASDTDGDTVSYYLYDSNPAAGSGHFVVDGTVVPSEYVYWINGAQLAQTSFVAGAGGTSDEVRVIAYDGQTYSNNSVFNYFNVNVVPNRAPVMAVSANVVATAGQTLAASSLFSASDADGDTLSYYLYDTNSAVNSGHFVVNGAVVPSEYVYWISAAQLAQTSFVAGAGGTSEDLRVIAYDGQAYSGATFSQFYVNVAPNHAPVMNVSATVSATAGQTLSASSLFSASDADGDTVSYYLYDTNSAANSGHFVVNGAVVPSEYVYWISAAQLVQTSFVAGAGGTSEDLRVIAYDGQDYSGATFSQFYVNVAPNHAPVMTVSANVSATAGQTLSASSLFSASDADGDTLSYYLYDANSAVSSGHFVVNGTVVPSEYVYWISAAQLAQTSFVAGAAGTSEELRVIAYDGQAYSGATFSQFHVDVAPNHAPVMTVSASVSLTAGQALSAASLFSASDADGDTLSYYLYDANSAVNSGYLSVNGTVVPPEFVYSVTAAQLAQTSFVAGAAGTADELRVIAFDGQTYSNNSVFTYFQVSAMAPAGSAAGGAPATGNDSFVFKPGLGQQAAVDFSQGVVNNYLPHADLSVDYFNQMSGTTVLTSIGVASDAGQGEALVDLLGVFGLHATDHGQFVF